MRKLIAFPIAMLVLFLTACGNSESQVEDVSMDTPPDESAVEADPIQEQTIESVVYYYFIEINGSDMPKGTVVVLPDILILAPAQSDISRDTDHAVNISSALRAMIDDPHNEWTSSDLEINEVTYDEGHTDVALQGEIFGAGDIVLIASRMQILLTVFADASVNTAAVTLNGECIGNLGTSHESEAIPADYAYTRSEIEAFLAYDDPESQ